MEAVSIHALILLCFICFSSLICRNCPAAHCIRQPQGGQEKQTPFPARRGERDRSKTQRFQYDQALVIRNVVPVPTDGRFPGSQIDTHVCLPDRSISGGNSKDVRSLLTVTRSHRFCTCFPFTPDVSAKRKAGHRLFASYAVVPRPQGGRFSDMPHYTTSQNRVQRILRRKHSKAGGKRMTGSLRRKRQFIIWIKAA